MPTVRISGVNSSSEIPLESIIWGEFYVMTERQIRAHLGYISSSTLQGQVVSPALTFPPLSLRRNCGVGRHFLGGHILLLGNMLKNSSSTTSIVVWYVAWVRMSRVKQKNLVSNHGPGAEGAVGVDKAPEPQLLICRMGTSYLQEKAARKCFKIYELWLRSKVLE